MSSEALSEYEQIILPETLQRSSSCFGQQWHGSINTREPVHWQPLMPDWPCKSRAKSHYFWFPKWWKAHKKTVVNHTTVDMDMNTLKAQNLQLKHIFFISFSIDCVGVYLLLPYRGELCPCSKYLWSWQSGHGDSEHVRITFFFLHRLGQIGLWCQMQAMHLRFDQESGFANEKQYSGVCSIPVGWTCSRSRHTQTSSYPYGDTGGPAVVLWLPKNTNGFHLFIF